ncbi:hypothetical protein K4F52_002568 [Lecanicillium sp. MT-2017a]|nr:hypothetical protein K4F52_002568 [Lecanicillium sp. MT-2017a]
MSLAQLSQLLPLPTEELQQVLDYASTLPKDEAANHFSNLLGDSPLAVDFISSFNARRQTPAAAAAAPEPSRSSASRTAESIDAVPKSKRGPKKKKADIHTPQARLVDSYSGPSGTAYNKKTSDLEYIANRASAPSSNHASRPATPPSAEPSANTKQAQPKQHASSAGFLVGDALSKPKAKSSSNPNTRSSTPKPAAAGNTTKISISGGTPMAGQSTAIADLDAAIRALEISTNPSLDSNSNPKARRCNCVATRHPLQSAAPNCLACGKVICMKEGLGPCTFCGAALLTADEVQLLVRELKDERGRERMAANASANRRAEIAQKPAPFSHPRTVVTGPPGPSLAEAASKAREHRDKLLNFQAQNARRTTVRDEAADFDVTAAVSGSGSMWATPEERARELKRQQKILREMEWNARPEYEKRQTVMSIDLVNGRVVRKMAAADRPPSPEEEAEVPEPEPPASSRSALTDTTGNRVGGAFSSNPLLGSLMKPMFKAKGKDASGPAEEGSAQPRRERRKGWRRVQDDQDDNEGVILDGGVHGHGDEYAANGDEPACG